MGTQLLLCDANRELSRLMSNLAGDQAAAWLAALRRLNEEGPVLSRHKVFWTLTLGKIPNLRFTLSLLGIALSDAADELMFKPGLVKVSAKIREVHLALYSVAELIPGADHTTKFDLREVCIAAEGMGLRKCHSEVPALLATQYRGLEEVYLPIAGSQQEIFILMRDDEIWMLAADEHAAGRKYLSTHRFVFEIKP